MTIIKRERVNIRRVTIVFKQNELQQIVEDHIRVAYVNIDNDTSVDFKFTSRKPGYSRSYPVEDVNLEVQVTKRFPGDGLTNATVGEKTTHEALPYDCDPDTEAIEG